MHFREPLTWDGFAAAMTAMQTASLQLGDTKVQLDERNPRVLLGRDPTCGLPTTELSVSRRHAEVYLSGDQIYIRDLGSSNGTWVNGSPVPSDGSPINPGDQVFLGHIPMLVEWSGGNQGKTVMGELPPDLKAMIEAHKNRQMAGGPFASVAAKLHEPAKPDGPPATMLGIGGREAPKAAEFAYRKQGTNNNGVLLIALKSDTYSNGVELDGYLEFTALDNETVASIIVELVEYHKKGPKEGHVWDRMLVRQGPWRCKKNEVVPLPFRLRVPPGTSVSGRDVHWEVRGYVDIAWAFDIAAASPINMRNIDIERIRDGLGALDYRLANLDPEPLGQRFTGLFQPPSNLRQQYGITDIHLAVEYLGTNLQITMLVEKTSLFKFDRQVKLVFDLQQFRSAPQAQVVEFMRQKIDDLMDRSPAAS
jgi:hypothetical protein